MNDRTEQETSFSKQLRQLEIKHLIAFEAIYSTRNISRAGQALGFSQPTMSNLLSNLRTTLDDQLFLRQARGVQPTSRADELIGPIRSALQEIERITKPRSGFDPEHDEREFRLHALDIFETLLIPPLVRKVQGNPGITFKMLLAPKIPIGEALESGEADLALGLSPSNQTDLRWEDILPIELMVVARKGHPRLQGSVTPKDIKELGHVSMDMEPGALANSHLLWMKKRSERRDIVRVTRPAAIIEIAAKTDLIGFANRYQIEASPYRDQIQALAPPAQLTSQQFQMTWHQRNDADPGLIWLKEAVRETLKDVREAVSTPGSLT